MIVYFLVPFRDMKLLSIQDSKKKYQGELADTKFEI